MNKHTPRKFQKDELAIFKWFVDICQKNNLKYCICGGSSLGRVGHKEFSPWDDDRDEAMSRLDFVKIPQIYISETGRFACWKIKN